MEKHNLEEYFNRRISEHSELIDKDELWDNLGLEKNKKSKKAIWLWFGILFICFAICGFWVKSYLHNQENLVSREVDNRNDNITKNTRQKELTFGNEEIKSRIDEIDFTIDDDSSKTDFNNNSLGSKSSSNIKLTDKEKRNKNFINEPKKLKDQRGNLIDFEQKNTTVDKRRKRDLELDKEIPPKESSTIPLQENQLIFDNKENDLVQNQINELENSQSQKLNKSDTIVDQTFEEQSDIGLLTESKALEKSDTTFTDESNKLTSSDLLNADNVFQSESENVENKELESKSLKASPWAFGIYGDVALVDRNLSGLFVRFDSLANVRNAAERTLERIGFGAYLKLNIRNGFYAKLGINYTSLNTELKARILSEEITRQDNFPLTIIIKEEGDSLFSNFGTYVDKQVIEEQHTIYTSHKLIDIPLSFGYNYKRGKLGFFTEVRPSVSLKHSYRGTMFNGQNLVDGNRYVDTSAKFSMGAAIGVSYQFSKSINIWSQPYYQTTFNSYLNENSGLLQTNSFWGVRLGFEIQF